jgi:hypothetical protein
VNVSLSRLSAIHIIISNENAPDLEALSIWRNRLSHLLGAVVVSQEGAPQGAFVHRDVGD